MASKPSPLQRDTVKGLLDAAKRPSRRVNIRCDFVQSGPQNRPAPGPLHLMLKNHDESGLDLYLLHRALVSSDKGTTRVSAIWRRLDEKCGLVERGRDGRLAVFTALREDGSRGPYTSPDGKLRSDRYFTVPFEYWTAEPGWYTTLPFPAKAMLLIASSLAPGFVLPTEKARPWYGISPESAERGLRVLRDVGLLHRSTVSKPAPLSPHGVTLEHHYRLLGPFERAKKPKLTVVRDRTAS